MGGERWKSLLRSRGAAFAHDLMVIPIAWLGAYWLSFNLEAIPAGHVETALVVLPAVVLVQGALFWSFGLYRGVWRFASMPDAVRILQATSVGFALAAVVLFLVVPAGAVPRSVLPLYAILLVVGVGGPRFVYRWAKDFWLRSEPYQRVLIAGAGQAGDLLARHLLSDPAGSYLPVAFADDNRERRGREIQGVRVRGGFDDIVALVKAERVELVLIALPAASSREMRRIVGACESAGVRFRTLPRMADLVSGKARFTDLREVSIEDLLGRDPVALDWEGISEGIRGKTVLVTGGGGSIGSELCRQVAQLDPAKLVLLDQNEFGLYSAEQELREGWPELELGLHLGDVSDASTVGHVMRRHKPQVVFHAAAYKHVPMLEPQIREAMRTSVLGTRNVALAAHEAGVDVFVLISTDKAVNPTNVMGASKRIAEIYCQNLARISQMRCITVRFGNVLGSAGSVVPLFRKQIEAGGPVTVTHPDITRYFMTITEACQLILQAAVMGRGGEIFVLDMGEPVHISYLAEQMIHLAGKVPGEDIEIVYTGLRPGEKLYEELFHDEESLAETWHENILLARHREVDWEELNGALARLEQACAAYDEQRLRTILASLVPEYTPARIPKGNVVRLHSTGEWKKRKSRASDADRPGR
jgi:FlaA1/EpsC-like NDP-sugar epimerase